MAVIGALGVEVNATVDRFIGPMSRAGVAAGLFGETMQHVGRVVKWAGVAVVAQGAAFTALTIRSIQQGAQLSRMSDTLGIITEDFSRLKFAAESTGSTMGQLSSGIRTMVRQLQDAASGGGSKNVLDRLGLDAGSLQKMRPDEAFRKIAESLRGVTNQREQLALFFKLFGEGSASLIDLARLSNEEFDILAGKAEGLGLVVSEEMGERLEMGSNALKTLGILATQSANTFAAALSPALVATTDLLVKFFSKGDTARDFFEGMADAAVQAVGTIVDFVNDVVATIRNMFLKLFRFLEAIVGEDVFRYIAGFNASDFEVVIDQQQEERQNKAQRFVKDFEDRVEAAKEKAKEVAAEDRAAKGLPGPAEPTRRTSGGRSRGPSLEQFESSLLAASDTGDRIQRVTDPQQLQELQRIREDLSGLQGGLG